MSFQLFGKNNTQIRGGDNVGGKVIINGVTYSGNNVTIDKDGNITIDGNKQGQCSINNTVNVEVTGTLQNLNVHGSVVCQDVTGDIDAGGSVQCGNVGGFVDAGGSITVSGSVHGNMDAGGSIRVESQK